MSNRMKKRKIAYEEVKSNIKIINNKERKQKKLH